MAIFQTFDLDPRFDGRKSFYGKAKVTILAGVITLKSYDTDILRVDTNKHTFEKLWGGWSHTTGRHIIEFAKQYGLPISCKKDYTQLDKYSEIKY